MMWAFLIVVALGLWVAAGRLLAHQGLVRLVLGQLRPDEHWMAERVVQCFYESMARRLDTLAGETPTWRWLFVLGFVPGLVCRLVAWPIVNREILRVACEEVPWAVRFVRAEAAAGRIGVVVPPDPAVVPPGLACYLCGKPGTPWVWAPPPDCPPSEDDHLVGYEGTDEDGCRAIVIHRGCLRAADFDQWTNRSEWTSLGPAVPWDLLPPLTHGTGDDSEWNVEQYPTPAELEKRR